MNGLSSLLIRAVLAVVVLAACVAPAVAQEVVEYIHTDALGSPVAITDASGNVIERTVYEPYGAVVNRPLKDGPGYTGHVTDSGTGLSYMQQRYYDSTTSSFLSVDPVSAFQSSVNAFGRYRYANANPYSLIDPDGRRACGKDWDCRMTEHAGGKSLSRGQLAAIKRDPQAYIDRANSIPNRQSSEAGSARYFSEVARPVTIATNLEVGADIAQLSDQSYTAVNFALGDATAGAGAGSVVQGQNNYAGPGVRVAIAHTHPVNTAFSYWKGSCFCGGRWEGSLYRGDLERARSAGVNSYVATPSGSVMGFDFRGMNGAVNARTNPGAYIAAEDYFFKVK
ncbi:TPA: hypothetical protein UMF63_001911 [Stenotrophomonas maltophilia]|nr:hypothetical protein [Stenotrophomonas maltophilia]